MGRRSQEQLLTPPVDSGVYEDGSLVQPSLYLRPDASLDKLFDRIADQKDLYARINHPDRDSYDPDLVEKVNLCQTIEEKLEAKRQHDAEIFRQQEAREAAAVARRAQEKAAAEQVRFEAEVAKRVEAELQELLAAETVRIEKELAAKYEALLAEQRAQEAAEQAAREAEALRLQEEQERQLQARIDLELSQINATVDARIAREEYEVQAAELEARHLRNREELTAKRALIMQTAEQTDRFFDQMHNEALTMDAVIADEKQTQAMLDNLVRNETAEIELRTVRSETPEVIQPATQVSELRAFIIQNRARRQVEPAVEEALTSTIEHADLRQAIDLEALNEMIDTSVAPIEAAEVDVVDVVEVDAVEIDEVEINEPEAELLVEVPEQDPDRRELLTKGGMLLVAGLVVSGIPFSNAPARMTRDKSGLLIPDADDVVSLRSAGLQGVAGTSTETLTEAPAETEKPAPPKPEVAPDMKQFTATIQNMINEMKKGRGKTWDGTAEELAVMFRDAAARYNNRIVTKEFLAALCYKESKYYRQADNPASTALGLSQFLDGTWGEYRRASGNPNADRLNARDSIYAMAWYSVKNYEVAMKKGGGKLTMEQLRLLTAAAYLGPGNVQRHGIGFISRGQGKGYADDFRKLYARFVPPVKAPAPEAAKPKPKRSGEQIKQEGIKRHGNVSGHLSPAELKPLHTGKHKLAPEAADAFLALNHAYKEQFDRGISVTDSYRDFRGQQATKRRRGDLAATPGKSDHGWGIAVDLGGGIQKFGTTQHNWMKKYAPKYSYIHPDWAQQGGSKPEAWHWEYK